MNPGLYASIAQAAQNVSKEFYIELMACVNTLTKASGEAAFQASFRQTWVLALKHIRDLDLLRALQPLLRPGLGFLGASWARIEMASLALTGALASEILLGFLLGILLAALVALLVLLALWLLGKLRQWMDYIPPQRPQEVQTPHWGKLLNYVKRPLTVRFTL